MALEKRIGRHCPQNRCGYVKRPYRDSALACNLQESALQDPGNGHLIPISCVLSFDYARIICIALPLINFSSVSIGVN